MLYAVEHYILIGLYTFLFVLAILNIWKILIKQRRYKTLPLLAFYVFTFCAVALRLLYIIMLWSKYTALGYYTNDYVLKTKLCVGLIQSWMIFEIALRERHTYRSMHFD